MQGDGNLKWFATNTCSSPFASDLLVGFVVEVYCRWTVYSNSTNEFSSLGMFLDVGEFVVDNSGKHKLLLNNESIVWPNNGTAPSSYMRKCMSCNEHCYNGKAIIDK